MLLTIDKDRTYSFHLRARLTLGIVACVVACVCAVIAGIFLILIQAYIALLVPVAWIGCGVAFLLLAKIHTNEYIIISPDGITLLGAKKRSNGTWIAMNSEQKIPWDKIQNIGFSTLFGSKPTFLFFDMTDGECLLFPIHYFYRPFRIVDIIRKHTKCSNLGNHFRYLQTRFPNSEKKDDNNFSS